MISLNYQTKYEYNNPENTNVFDLSKNGCFNGVIVVENELFC